MIIKPMRKERMVITVIGIVTDADQDRVRRVLKSAFCVLSNPPVFEFEGPPGSATCVAKTDNVSEGMLDTAHLALFNAGYARPTPSR